MTALNWHAEYVYRSRFHATHQQYLDEPDEVIQWMVRIDQIVQQVAKARQDA